VHSHVPTGEIRECARPGCRAAWGVTCHNGKRRVCDICARAVKRERDRSAKARIRKQARRNAEVYDARHAVKVARSNQQTLEELAALTPEELDALQALALAMNEGELDGGQAAETELGEDELDDSQAAGIERDLDELTLAEKIAQLEQALDFAASRNDAHGVRVAREALNAFSSSRR
jgi:hypothetical protein